MIEINAPFVGDLLVTPFMYVDDCEYLRMMAFSDATMNIVFEWSMQQAPVERPGSMKTYNQRYLINMLCAESEPHIVVRSAWLRIKFQLIDCNYPLQDFIFRLHARGKIPPLVEDPLQKSIDQASKSIDEVEEPKKEKGSGIRGLIPRRKSTDIRLPEFLVKGSILYADSQNHLSTIPPPMSNSLLAFHDGKAQWISQA